MSLDVIPDINRFLIPLALGVLPIAAFASEKPSLNAGHATRNIEGRNVRLDNRLLKGDSAALGERALKLLSARLVKSVHIPKVESFFSAFENHRMSWVVMRELAHAYQDQVLGIDESRVTVAWRKFLDSGNTSPC